MGRLGQPLAMASPPTRQYPLYERLPAVALEPTDAPSTYSLMPDGPWVATAWCQALSLYEAAEVTVGRLLVLPTCTPNARRPLSVR